MPKLPKLEDSWSLLLQLWILPLHSLISGCRLQLYWHFLLSTALRILSHWVPFGPHFNRDVNIFSSHNTSCLTFLWSILSKKGAICAAEMARPLSFFRFRFWICTTTINRDVSVFHRTSVREKRGHLILSSFSNLSLCLRLCSCLWQNKAVDPRLVSVVGCVLCPELLALLARFVWLSLLKWEWNERKQTTLSRGLSH